MTIWWSLFNHHLATATSWITHTTTQQFRRQATTHKRTYMDNKSSRPFAPWSESNVSSHSHCHCHQSIILLVDFTDKPPHTTTYIDNIGSCVRYAQGHSRQSNVSSLSRILHVAPTHFILFSWHSQLRHGSRYSFLVNPFSCMYIWLIKVLKTTASTVSQGHVVPDVEGTCQVVSREQQDIRERKWHPFWTEHKLYQECCR